MERKHPHMDRIMRVIDYIHANADQDLSLDQLADVAAMSRFHWQKVFSAIMGASPAATIRSVRMHKASMLLVRTDMPVPQIAVRVGYDNDRSFARTFKDSYGVTPAAFRKRGQTADHRGPIQGHSLMFEVTTKEVPDMRLAALSHRGDYAEGSACYQKVSTIMSTGNHWPHTGGMAGVYYDDPSTTPIDDLRSHAGVIWNGADIPDGLEDVALAGGNYAILHFKGPYSGLVSAYRFLYGDWLAGSQAELRDAPSFEVYLNDPTNTAPDDLRTDIYMPLAG
ncbi:AraC family transcriptional regulator [Octadecabacter sp. G9-8]|uniref:AraC family transcriptional regulator n=1 Tax=Octadecabacter dasysiphoniae TaxID=2909341 RepID=A0ABS9CWC6_9RHOB|nr:AraC family transcriptional regulator [Octadecabacter dasysiphoniae]MCF2871149.1 AraC family transcriptional regulator [Octadecabacter dasysiphoniae]